MYCSTLADLVRNLGEAKSGGTLKRRVSVLTHPSLLVVDEICYIPISQNGAMLFFQPMSRRHKHVATVVTSKKGFEEWGDVLGDKAMVAALFA